MRIFGPLALLISTQVMALTPFQEARTNQLLMEYSSRSFMQKHTAKGVHFSEAFNILDSEDGWFNQNPDEARFYGISSSLAYKQFGLPPKENEIIVAVIDSGVDVNHEDLQGKIWTNENEIPNNGIDDDNNGFIDDIYGWNFIGSKEGVATFEQLGSTGNKYKLVQGDQSLQVRADSLSVTREYKRLLDLKNGLASINEYLSEEEENQLKKYKEEVESNYEQAFSQLSFYKESLAILKEAKKVLRQAGVETFNYETLDNISFENELESSALELIIEYMDRGLSEESINTQIENQRILTDYHYNIDSNTRDLIKDDQSDMLESNYGNNDVIGPDAFHGTHVAGIIAANRNNEIGIAGVAENVKIMALRAVPNGDERDKDIANSIRYAVDNGAKVINMSFGKRHSPHTEVVEAAIIYAQNNDVLLIHAAGNENTNNDTETVYPNKYGFEAIANNWIEVGASNPINNSNFAARFSNYGKTRVDIFAPGVRINSTIPGNQYATASGTSMAAPVTSGLAATLFSYKPDLSAKEVRDLILGTTHRFPTLMVRKPSIGEILFSDLSVTGGTPNMIAALDAMGIPRIQPETEEVVEIAETEVTEQPQRRRGWLRRLLARFKRKR